MAMAGLRILFMDYLWFEVLVIVLYGNILSFIFKCQLFFGFFLVFSFFFIKQWV